MEKLLFTGGTGFLGRNIKPILDKTYEVTTIGIMDTDMLKANFVTDVPELPERYDIVLHAAGKAHIYPKTEAERKSFYDVNLTGTIHLCDALEKVGAPKSFIFISTSGVYGIDNGNYVTEDTPLLGEEPYQKSKVQAEEYLQRWCKNHDVVLTILRPSLMVGRGAPGNLGAMLRGIQKGFYLNIAGGKAKKSLLMADDIANLVNLAKDKGGVFNVCDDYNPSFGELSKLMAKQSGKHAPISVPYWMAWCLAKIGDVVGDIWPINSQRLRKIVTDDTISNEKAKRELGWQPMDVLTNYKI